MGFQVKDLEQALCITKVVMDTGVYTNSSPWPKHVEKEALLKSLYGKLILFFVSLNNHPFACRPT